MLSATIIRDHILWGKIIRERGRRKWEVYNRRAKAISNSPLLRANVTGAIFIGRCAVYICLVLWTHSPFFTPILGRQLGNLVLRLLADAGRLGIPTRDERLGSYKEGTQFSCFFFFFSYRSWSLAAFLTWRWVLSQGPLSTHFPINSGSGNCPHPLPHELYRPRKLNNLLWFPIHCPPSLLTVTF